MLGIESGLPSWGDIEMFLMRIKNFSSRVEHVCELFHRKQPELDSAQGGGIQNRYDITKAIIRFQICQVIFPITQFFFSVIANHLSFLILKIDLTRVTVLMSTPGVFYGSCVSSIKFED